MGPFGAHRFPLFEAARKISDASVVEYPRPRRERPQQGAVMAHENNGPAEFGDGIFERFDRFDVEMVGRLIKDQEIRPGQHYHRERDAGTLATRQGTRAALHRVTRKAKSSKMSLHGSSSPRGSERRDDVVQRLISGTRAILADRVR